MRLSRRVSRIRADFSQSHLQRLVATSD